MPLEHWPQAIQMLAQVDPARAQLVSDTLTKWGAIQQAQQQEQQRQAQVQHQQFEATVASEDARLTEMFGGDKAAAEAANNATIAYLSENGVPRHQIIQMLKTNLVLSSAEARKTIGCRRNTGQSRAHPGLCRKPCPRFSARAFFSEILPARATPARRSRICRSSW